MYFKTQAFLISVLVYLMYAGCKETPSSQDFKNITPKEMRALLPNDSLQLIDIRTPIEFEEGHIENAHNINYFDALFLEQINTLSKKKPVYIYCRSGKRSVKSIAIFQEAGFLNIYQLEGGILNWEAQGFSVIKDSDN